MGHRVAGGIYARLGTKIDGLAARVPWNETFYEILRALYTPAEAEVLVAMPCGLSTFDEIERATRSEPLALRATLESLCEKGLVFDLWFPSATSRTAGAAPDPASAPSRDASGAGQYRYMPAPLVVGIFEMTMMRTRGDLRPAEWARLFHDYMHGDDAFYAANFGQGERVSVLRTLPHEEAVRRDASPDAGYVEILDYERATAIVDATNQYAIGLCSCRHEKLHTGAKTCAVPLDTCSSFGPNADVLIRHGMAREVSRTEMLENLARSRELKLVLSADNVQRGVGFICHCCGCCCNVLLGVSQHGYPHAIVTSTYIAEVDAGACTGCGQCARACPIQAIAMAPVPSDTTTKRRTSRVDETLCLGCGVCALTCPKRALSLVKRAQRVLHPETTFERIILASLERGTLQNQLLGDPHAISTQFLQGLIGGFLRLPPVKQALMSDQLRSTFLAALKAGVRLQGKGWLTEM